MSDYIIHSAKGFEWKKHKYIKKILNDNSKLPFEEETIDAYNYRLKEFEDPKTSMISKH